MAVVGWMEWQFGGKSRKGLQIRTLKPWKHGLIIMLLLIIGMLNGWYLAGNTSAEWPYVDSLTTWASIATTFMVVLKILENWLYWLVIDSISIILYIDRELYLTALLFAAYLVIVIFGYMQWRRKFQQQRIESSTPAIFSRV